MLICIWKESEPRSNLSGKCFLGWIWFLRYWGGGPKLGPGISHKIWNQETIKLVASSRKQKWWGYLTGISNARAPLFWCFDARFMSCQLNSYYEALIQETDHSNGCSQTGKKLAWLTGMVAPEVGGGWYYHEKGTPACELLTHFLIQFRKTDHL